MRFELSGSIADDGELICRGVDSGGQKIEYRARSASTGPEVKPVADLAAEILRRGVAHQADAKDNEQEGIGGKKGGADQVKLPS